MHLSPSQVIVLATPVFLLLIAAEYAYGRAKGRNTYRLNDAVNSISLGMLSEVTKVLTLLLRVGIYTAVYHAAAMGPGPEFWTSWYGWLMALVFYDLCYYWLHRGGHEVAVLLTDYAMPARDGVALLGDQLFAQRQQGGEQLGDGPQQVQAGSDTYAPVQAWIFIKQQWCAGMQDERQCEGGAAPDQPPHQPVVGEQLSLVAFDQPPAAIE